MVTRRRWKKMRRRWRRMERMRRKWGKSWREMKMVVMRKRSEASCDEPATCSGSVWPCGGATFLTGRVVFVHKHMDQVDLIFRRH